MTIGPSRKVERLRNRRVKRIFVVSAFGLLILCLSLIATLTGAFGIFTSTGESETVAIAGSVKLGWNDTSSTRLDTEVGPLQPGGSLELPLNLSNSGVVSLSTIQISVTSAQTGSLSDGFRLAIDSCSMPWVQLGDAFSCDGVTRVVSPERPVSGLISVPGSEALRAGGTDHLRVTYSLPDSAPDSAEGSTGMISLVATGIQREGQTR
jgi:hypothetical protein